MSPSSYAARPGKKKCVRRGVFRTGATEKFHGEPRKCGSAGRAQDCACGRREFWTAAGRSPLQPLMLPGSRRPGAERRGAGPVRCPAQFPSPRAHARRAAGPVRCRGAGPVRHPRATGAVPCGSGLLRSQQPGPERDAEAGEEGGELLRERGIGSGRSGRWCGLRRGAVRRWSPGRCAREAVDLVERDVQRCDKPLCALLSLSERLYLLVVEVRAKHSELAHVAIAEFGDLGAAGRSFGGQLSAEGVDLLA